MAGKWEDFQQNKDLYPNLRYEAVNDERTRQKHREWDGFVAPIDHPVWKTMYPPNDWGCRCPEISGVQTDDPVSKDLPEANLKGAFKNNAAVSGKVFQDVPYADGLDDASITLAEINALRFLARHSDEAVRRNAEHIILSLPREKQFVEIYAKGKKGKVLEHILVNPDADDYKEILDSAKAFAKKGKVAEMLPEVKGKDKLQYRSKIFPNYDLLTNPDLRVDAIYFDVKRPKAIKNITGLANEASFKQGAVAVIHCGKLKISLDIIARRANAILNDKNPFYTYDKVCFYFNDIILEFA